MADRTLKSSCRLTGQLKDEEQMELKELYGEMSSCTYQGAVACMLWNIYIKMCWQLSVFV